MTTPSKPPVTDKIQENDDIMVAQPCLKGSVALEPITDIPPRKAVGRTAGGVHRLSTISEQEADSSGSDSSGGSGWAASSFSLCSDRFKRSSSGFSSEASSQTDAADDCAAVLLACLYCRFHELMALLPDTFERAVSRCFPSLGYVTAPGESEQPGKDCWSCKMDLDFNVCGSCQDSAELLELAMEISEVCYR